MWKWKSRPALHLYKARRVCLIKPSALGDVVQTLPVLAALRHRYPAAHLAWVVNRSYAGLLEGHPDLDEIIEFERKAAGARRLQAIAGLARGLREGCFDLVCDLQGLLRTGLMAAVTGARRRVGLGRAREGARLLYTDMVPVPTLDMPAVDRYWLLAEALGVGDLPKRFEIPLRAADRAWARRQLTDLPRPLIALHPGARWETKRWPAEHFVALAAKAHERLGAGIVLVGGSEEAPVAQEIASRLNVRPFDAGDRGLGRHVLALAGRTDLKQLAAVLAEADLVVSGDSGPMHLAAALGTPVVGIFTCTSPVRAAPYGRGHTVVATQVPCAASYLKTCSRLDCMRELSAERVWPAVAAQLQRCMISLQKIL